MSELLEADRRSQETALFWRLYMGSWAALSCGALVYLGSFALNPEGQSGFLAKPPQSEQESNRSEFDRAQLAAQVRSLNDTVASMRDDLARLRAQQPNPTTARAPASAIETERTTNATQPPFPTFTGSNPISTSSVIEQPEQHQTLPAAQPPLQQPVQTAAIPPQAQPQTADAITAAQPEPKPAPAALQRGRNMATTLLKPGTAPPLPGLLPRHDATQRAPQPTIGNPYRPTLLNSETTSSSGIATPVAIAGAERGSNPIVPPNRNAELNTVASPQQLAPVFGAPKVQQNNIARAAALALSTATSVTGLRASWLFLTTNQPETFAGYTPRYVSDPATGTYRLLAGPIVNHSEADRVCNQLRAQNISCGVSDYAGTPL